MRIFTRQRRELNDDCCDMYSQELNKVGKRSSFGCIYGIITMFRWHHVAFKCPVGIQMSSGASHVQWQQVAFMWRSVATGVSWWPQCDRISVCA